MRAFLKVLTSVVIVILLGIFLVLFLVFDSDAIVIDESVISSLELQQTLAFLVKSDPRNLRPGSTTALTIRDEDMELFLNYILENARNGAAEVNISEGLITTVSSVKLPSYFLERYLNLQITMSSVMGILAVEKLKLGKLECPVWLANTVMRYGHKELTKKIPEYAEIINAITSYRVVQNEVIITYQWQPELIELLSNRGRDLLIEDDDKERLRIYAVKLAEITNNPSLPFTISLVDLLGPMFEFALFRSGDPAEENGAAITTMALYVMDINIAKILGTDTDSIPLERHRITLAGRQDFAKHFLTSAAITINSNTSIADSFGLMKEIEDSSTGGSGFSFTDVGADRAGVRFAELAISNSQNAVSLQRKVADNLSESIFIPDLKGLPEFMSEDEFLTEYGGVNQPEFQSVIADIEERISQLPIFNSL